MRPCLSLKSLNRLTASRWWAERRPAKGFVLKRLPLAFIAALTVLVLDQLTKSWVVSNLALYESIYPIPAISHFFAITHLTNTGAAFGLLKDAGTFFAIASVIIVIVIVVYLRRLPREQRMMRLALGMLVGGALGNLLDRVRLGHVIDFVDFSFFAKFNLADSAISISVVILFFISWLDDRSKSTPDTVIDEALGSESPQA